MAAYGIHTTVFPVEFMENLFQGLSDPVATQGYSNTKYPTKSEFDVNNHNFFNWQTYMQN